MTSPIRSALRARLRDALRGQDRETVGAIRSLLAALENAEAVPGSPDPAAPGPWSPHVAGAVAGLGAGEAPRRVLSPDEEQAVVERELAELRSASERLAEAGRHDRSAGLLRVAQAIEDVLGA